MNTFPKPGSVLASSYNSVTARKVVKLITAILIVCAVFVIASQAYALTGTQAATIVNAARAKIGTPYKLPPDGFPKNTDCSLLTQYCYKQAGITIPRTAAEQYKWCNQCSFQAGTLIFFACDDSRPGVPTHVGINLGNGRMIDANSATGKVVEEQWQGNAYWQRRLLTSGTR